MINPNSKWAASLMVLALVASACGVRTKTTPLAPRFSHAPTCADAIETYQSRAQVPNDYYEVAWISAEGNSVYTSEGKIQEQVRKKAADAGANAVIVNDFKEAANAPKVIGAALGANSADTKTSALAIYVAADSSRVTLKCGK
jgi:hypothetical protein